MAPYPIYTKTVNAEHFDDLNAVANQRNLVQVLWEAGDDNSLNGLWASRDCAHGILQALDIAAIEEYSDRDKLRIVVKACKKLIERIHKEEEEES